MAKGRMHLVKRRSGSCLSANLGSRAAPQNRSQNAGMGTRLSSGPRPNAHQGDTAGGHYTLSGSLESPAGLCPHVFSVTGQTPEPGTAAAPLAQQHIRSAPLADGFQIHVDISGMPLNSPLARLDMTSGTSGKPPTPSPRRQYVKSSRAGGPGYGHPLMLVNPNWSVAVAWTNSQHRVCPRVLAVCLASTLHALTF